MMDIEDYRKKQDRVVQFFQELGCVIDASAAQAGWVVIDGIRRTFPELYDMASQDPKWLASEDEFPYSAEAGFEGGQKYRGNPACKPRRFNSG